jgi:hypothetical protein
MTECPPGQIIFVLGTLNIKSKCPRDTVCYEWVSSGHCMSKHSVLGHCMSKQSVLGTLYVKTECPGTLYVKTECPRDIVCQNRVSWDIVCQNRVSYGHCMSEQSVLGTLYSQTFNKISYSLHDERDISCQAHQIYIFMIYPWLSWACHLNCPANYVVNFHMSMDLKYVICFACIKLWLYENHL